MFNSKIFIFFFFLKIWQTISQNNSKVELEIPSECVQDSIFCSNSKCNDCSELNRCCKNHCISNGMYGGGSFCKKTRSGNGSGINEIKNGSGSGITKCFCYQSKPDCQKEAENCRKSNCENCEDFGDCCSQ